MGDMVGHKHLNIYVHKVGCVRIEKNKAGEGALVGT